MENNEGPFWTWYARKFGVEQMEAIQQESHGVARFSILDLEQKVIDLKKDIENVCLESTV